MAYHKPSFKKIKYDQWSFYNDKCGYFQEYDNINFIISQLIKLNRIPVFLIYVSVPEFEVQILEIKSILSIRQIHSFATILVKFTNKLDG